MTRFLRRPLNLPLIAGLDMRPRWERHPTGDRYRRGERAWQSTAELMVQGIYRIRIYPKLTRIYMSAAVK